MPIPAIFLRLSRILRPGPTQLKINSWETFPGTIDLWLEKLLDNSISLIMDQMTLTMEMMVRTWTWLQAVVGDMQLHTLSSYCLTTCNAAHLSFQLSPQTRVVFQTFPVCDSELL